MLAVSFRCCVCARKGTRKGTRKGARKGTRKGALRAWVCAWVWVRACARRYSVRCAWFCLRGKVEVDLGVPHEGALGLGLDHDEVLDVHVPRVRGEVLREIAQDTAARFPLKCCYFLMLCFVRGITVWRPARHAPAERGC